MLNDVSSHALWWSTRATGLVSLALLTVVFVLGITGVKRWAPRGWPLFAVGAIHRNASLLAVVLVAIHVSTTVIDGYVDVSWWSAVIPFTATYRPLWLGLGATAVDLVLAVIATSLLRSHLRHRTWQTVHWAAYACWPIAFVHGLGAGTDTTTVWVLSFDAVCLVAVVAAVGWRLSSSTSVSRRHARRVRSMAGAGLAAAPDRPALDARTRRSP